MNENTKTLTSEHRLIGRAACCLDRLADHARETDDLCIVTAIDLLEFFQDFVDTAHQAKEERCLFPALLESGLARHRVRELLEDHANEREALSAMRSYLEGAAYGDPSSRDEFVRAATEYATMQREHAEEEESVLIPLAEELLSEEQSEALAEAFRQVDASLLPRSRSYYFELVASAAVRLGSSYGPLLSSAS